MNQWRLPLFTAGRLVMALLVGALPLAADDLTGSDRFLCSATQATGCVDGGDCIVVPLRELNIPEFIEVDLEQGTLSTTEASHENRVTPIQTQERADGLIHLLGVQQERSFSIVVGEASGQMSAAILTDGLGVIVFGICTPMPTSN